MELIFFGLIILGLAGVYYSVISFPLFMLLILLLTGVIWLIDRLFFEKKRDSNAPLPTVVDYAKSFFPVILLVFLVRSFLAEPFKIPSGSMMPTLLAGDFILVNKYTYGLRLPILNNVMVEMNQPKRGDVIVFHYPPDPKVDYIKRVIGLPGDTIRYQDKRLTINGHLLDVSDFQQYADEQATIVGVQKAKEQLDQIKHDILIYDIPSRYEMGSLGEKLANGETITVPAGHYFAMGDNRDNSSDSRVWGFVPDENLVGKAFFIWFNFDAFGRIGSKIQ